MSQSLAWKIASKAASGGISFSGSIFSPQRLESWPVGVSLQLSWRIRAVAWERQGLRWQRRQSIAAQLALGWRIRLTVDRQLQLIVAGQDYRDALWDLDPDLCFEEDVA